MANNILETLKTDAELEAFLQAQQQSLIEVSKKINELQNENEKLRKHAETLTAENNAQRTLYLKEQEYTDAEIICVNQLERLRILAEERTFTLEETKRTEILTKVLESIRKTDKKELDITKDIDTEELLRIVGNDNE